MGRETSTKLGRWGGYRVILLFATTNMTTDSDILAQPELLLAME